MGRSTRRPFTARTPADRADVYISRVYDGGVRRKVAAGVKFSPNIAYFLPGVCASATLRVYSSSGYGWLRGPRGPA